MIDKIAVSCLVICYKVRTQLEKPLSDEDGGIKLKIILAILLSLVLAGILTELLTRNRVCDEGHGVIGHIVSVVIREIKFDIEMSKWENSVRVTPIYLPS